MDQKDEQDQEQKEEVSPPQIISYPYQVILAQMLGVPMNQIHQAMAPFQNMIVLAPPIVPPPLIIPPSSPLTSDTSSDHESEQAPTPKRPKLNHTPVSPGPYKETTEYNYLLLSSGREFYFSPADGGALLTPLHVEPRPFIRRLLSRVPVPVRDALLFLSDFISEEKTMVIDVDRVSESVERPEDATELDLSTLFSRDDFIAAWIRESRLRRVFRTVLQRWRIRRIDNKYTPDVDPITLSLPEKPVFVYDLSVSKKFAFEARSLANYLETRLAYNEGGFASPIFPKNPWTNGDFTYHQILSIYYQLKEYGELRWGLVTLQKYHFDLAKWHIYHRSTLTLQSIKNSLRLLDSSDARDILDDFILTQLEETGVIVTDYISNAYRVAMMKDPDHWYLQYWKEIAWIHYEADHFGRNRSRYIRARCHKLIQHHRRFLKELRDKKWILPEDVEEDADD